MAFKRIHGIISKLKYIRDFESLKNEGVLKLFRDFDRAFIDYSYAGMMSIIVDKILAPELQKDLSTEGYKKDKIQEYMQILTAQDKITNSFKEKIDFLRLVNKFKKNKKIDGVLVKKHCKKYCWLPVFYGDEFYKEKYFINKVKEELNKNFEDEILGNKFLNKVKEEQKAIKKELGAKGKTVIKLTNIIKYYGYRRMVFAETVGMANYYVLPLISEIGKRIGTENQEIQFFTSKEIIDSLIRKNSFVSKKEIMARMKECAVAQIGQDVKILSGNFYKKIKKNIKNECWAMVDNLRGTAVSGGKITGIVKVIKNASEINKLKKGEIIVAPMTSVDYMIAVRKATAIITDEGGLTCHAAIVSRELGIPCVVGTKFATKILKDGDVVEVDANKGLISLK